MTGFSRRSFLAAGAAVAVAGTGPAFSAEMRRLRAGERTGGMSLMEALKLRRSTRLYSGEAIARGALSNARSRPEEGP